ncbi:superfamily II DNA or RNA helicase [Microcella putealis]|uniref:Superfamily II DNA or RNA helicase n=1 Tax=Microcella putealis TaxID=337005 RepID=A0A4Q7LM98_9MICO|nr:helicase-related protein [Microcella putealis]RZS55233.1 superfamily II DNA or RNA helicase [Microcella putealis]TQM23505.1 superfamily II DNA or RNA helicase [Microcella putealis]
MSTQQWGTDPALSAEIEAQYESAIAAYAAKPTLITEHANHEESIRTGGYANRTLLELVQNAADAMAGSDGDSADGRVEIVLDPASRVLYCANSGRPFSKTGLIAITHAHLSGKRGDEIGRFGLGFKSVLAVTDSPQVLSRSVSFEFNSSKAQAAIKAIGSTSRRLPVLRTATALDHNAVFERDEIARDLGSWATTIVRLPHVEGVDRLRREMENFSSEFLLFVNAVREVRLSVLGDSGFTTSHTSRELGRGRFKIERPDGAGDEWLVSDRMHAPSAAARREVGEAVSRDEIKVSVAVPVKPRRANEDTGDPGTQIGQFWSYFPLQDRTSATGFFNAPWSVNDDRTTLLRNAYNREILATLAEMFVELLPQLSTADDPAAQLDYLPARGREAIYFGDEVLCALVPPLAVEARLIPDGRGVLRSPEELRPLDFTCEWKIPQIAHEAWVASPHTSDDVPHWRCYASQQRLARLRQLFVVNVIPDRLEEETRDLKRALELMPKRGIQSWLREWAEGADVESAANALKVVLANRGAEGAEQARVIPTTEGMKAIGDRSLVFLSKVDDLDIEGAAFVSPEFLAYPDVEKGLRSVGIRDLDPVAILNARLVRLAGDDSHEMQEKFWDAALGVTTRDALTAIRSQPAARILVPTRDGGWRYPQQVLDLDSELLTSAADRLLDRQRCIPGLAHELGVTTRPISDYSFEDEFAAGEYQEWVLRELNDRLTPGDRPIERISLYSGQASSPGPFSALLLLQEAGASEQLRESWTRGLLEFGDSSWECEDTATGISYRVMSPVRWAVERAGLLRTTRGYRPVANAVAPSLVEYRDLLPLYEGPRVVAEVLRLPQELSQVHAEVLCEALAVELLPPRFDDAVLVEFILDALPIAYPDGQPPRLPARVGRSLESRPSSTIYIAVDDEQRDYLAHHQRPYLLADEERAHRLVKEAGCKRFEDSFAFSIRIDGRRDVERLLDVFPGLRGWAAGQDLSDLSISRADSIEKWVTTEEGVETQSLGFHRDGVNLIVASSLDERGALSAANEAYDLGMNNADIEHALRVGLDHHLELLRQSALAASNDADRLDVYFGEDDMREKLPKGLWQGLEAQGLVTKDTSVASLCLSVYGKDAISELADLFRREGFPDVPTHWAGGSATITWLRRMGFGAEYAGQRTQRQDAEFVVPGATVLPRLHDYQAKISTQIRSTILEVGEDGKRSKAMVELPTGAGKTRVASQTILQLFIDGKLRGPVLWIAQSQELCEQAVQTFSEVWRGLCTDQRVDMPLSVARLWGANDVQAPDTDLSVVVATDAKLEVILGKIEYEWLSAAEAVFIDEGHVAGVSARYRRILSWLGIDGRGFSRPLIGLSATPFKGTSSQATDLLAARFGRKKIAAFEDNPYQQLVGLGVLARVKHDVLEGAHVRLSEEEALEAKRTNRVTGTVLDRVAADHARMGSLVDSIMNLDESYGRSVLVFTPNVLSAQVLAATLRFRGIEAASVSGLTGRQERRDVIRRFRDGHIQVLANCDLLTQGFDAPGVTALYIARPTFSPNAYIQMAGRGLRGPRNGGKEECLIVDMADNFGSADINNLLGFREYEELWQEQNS